MISQEVIKSLKDNPYFKIYQDHVLEQMSSLNSIADLSDLSDEQAGQLARARALAINILKDILAPVMDFKEKREPTTEEIQKKKKRYGI